jgi:hypothetical protein
MSTSRFTGRFRAFAVAVAVAGAAATAVVASAYDAGAASGCQVTYRVNQWQGGFVAYIDVTAGSNPVHGWTVTWTYAAGQQITSSWSAQVSQAGTAVTATNLTYNADLAANATLEFGVQGTWNTSNPDPNDLAVTGSGCAPTTTPSSAAPSPTLTSASPRPSSPSPAPSSASPAPSSPSPSNPPPAGCAGAVICDGFENQAAGTPSGDWNVAFRDCSGAGTATVDTSTAHAGGKSLKITGAAGYCNHVFVASTKNLTGVGSIWFARFYVRHTTALPTAHVTFVAMRDSGDNNKDLRMGGQGAALQWNRESDDATLPAQSPVGIGMSMPLATNQWACVEFMVNRSTGTMDTWVNGAQVAGLHNDGVPTQDVDAQWLARTNWRPSLSDFRLGWESYGEGADTLWFDDVALSGSRIGC